MLAAAMACACSSGESRAPLLGAQFGTGGMPLDSGAMGGAVSSGGTGSTDTGGAATSSGGSAGAGGLLGSGGGSGGLTTGGRPASGGSFGTGGDPCAACPPTPQHGFSQCNNGQCEFGCDSGFVRNGATCIPLVATGSGGGNSGSGGAGSICTASTSTQPQNCVLSSTSGSAYFAGTFAPVYCGATSQPACPIGVAACPAWKNCALFFTPNGAGMAGVECFDASGAALFCAQADACPCSSCTACPLP